MIETTQPVAMMNNVQSPRPLDHQIVQVINQNAHALGQAQRLISLLSEDVRRLESLLAQKGESRG
jgi:hypothetical protein